MILRRVLTALGFSTALIGLVFAQSGGPTGNPPTGTCGGDLGGTFPSCTVTGGSHLTGTLASGLTIPSATLTTPSLGVATGTSLALGGATLGSNAMAINTGANTQINFTNNGTYNCLSFNGNNCGSSSSIDIEAGATADNELYLDSGGGVVLRAGGVVSVTAKGSGAATVTGGSAALTLGSSTYASCTALTTTSNIVGCTASALRFKDVLGSIGEDQAIAGIKGLRPGIWRYQRRYWDQFGGPRVRVGLYADDVAKMDTRCVTYDPDGQLKDYEERCIIAYLMAAMQGQQREIDQLRHRKS